MKFVLFDIFAIYFLILEVHGSSENVTETVKKIEEFVPHIFDQKLGDNATAKQVIDKYVAFLRSNVKTPRVKELEEKLRIIDKYVLDQEKYSELLKNETADVNFTSTKFFEALNEDDSFKFLEANSSKNLYVNFKEKLNRDDIEEILRERSIISDGRRSLGNGPKEEAIDDVVDTVIAGNAQDNHNFNASVKDSKYWDPQEELEQLRERHKHDGRRIYKGERTSVKYYPFMVSVHIMGRFWCGGVMYTSDLTLTSASCLQLLHNNRFFRENPRAVMVKVGSNHSRLGGEDIAGLEVYFYPSYNPRTLRHNIAIIRLRRHLNFNYHRVPKVIAISHEHLTLPDTVEVLLLGWGVKKFSQRMSYEPVFLQRKFLPVYPNKFCKEIYGDKFITETMFCAGTMTTGEGACDHDAGGPAILAGKLVGIISFGPTMCGFPNVPTVFTLVGAYDDWIESVRDAIPSYITARVRTTTKSDWTVPDLNAFKKYTLPKSEFGFEHHFTPIEDQPEERPTTEAETAATIVKESEEKTKEDKENKHIRMVKEPSTPVFSIKKMTHKNTPVKMVNEVEDWSVDFKK